MAGIPNIEGREYYGGPHLSPAEIEAERARMTIEAKDREIASLRADLERLRMERTQVQCAACTKGVRSRYAVNGLCPDCAENEIEGLKAEAERLKGLLVDQAGNSPAVSLEARDGRIDLAVRPPHWALRAMALSFMGSIGDAPNWSSIEIGPLPTDGGTLIATVRRANGDTPEETVGKLRKEVARLKASAAPETGPGFAALRWLPGPAQGGKPDFFTGSQYLVAAGTADGWDFAVAMFREDDPCVYLMGDGGGEPWNWPCDEIDWYVPMDRIPAPGAAVTLVTVPQTSVFPLPPDCPRAQLIARLRAAGEGTVDGLASDLIAAADDIELMNTLHNDAEKDNAKLARFHEVMRELFDHGMLQFHGETRADVIETVNALMAPDYRGPT